MGSVAARLAHEMGMKVVALSGSKGGIYRPAGLNPSEVEEYLQKADNLTEFPRCDTITNEDLLALDCDVLIVAAIENVITSRNAEQVKAKIIAEGANGR